MLMQFILQLLPFAIAGFIAYLTYSLSVVLKNGYGISAGFCYLLENTPALDAFIMVIFRGLILAATGLMLFGKLSNHSILSLDILYLFSLLMLILYHTFKEFSNPLMKTA